MNHGTLQDHQLRNNTKPMNTGMTIHSEELLTSPWQENVDQESLSCSKTDSFKLKCATGNMEKSESFSRQIRQTQTLTRCLFGGVTTRFSIQCAKSQAWGRSHHAVEEMLFYCQFHYWWKRNTFKTLNVCWLKQGHNWGLQQKDDPKQIKTGFGMD